MKEIQVLTANRSVSLLSVAAMMTGTLLLFPTLAHAQGGVGLSTNHCDTQLNYQPFPHIAVDGSGNVFVTGVSQDVGGGGATIKYSGEGVPLWTNRPGGAAGGAGDVVVDSSGNVFVSTSSGLIKYSNSGVPLWTRRYNGPGNDADVASAIAVDSAGNVFVTGSSANSSGNSDCALPACENRIHDILLPPAKSISNYVVDCLIKHDSLSAAFQ